MIKFDRRVLAVVLLLASPGCIDAAEEGTQAPGDKLPVAIFAKLPFFQNLALSPDGTKMAFIAPIKGRKHLLAKSMVDADAKYHILPPGDKSDIAWFRWASNERLLISYSATARRRDNDFEETRLLSTHFDMSDPVWVVRPDRDRDGASYGQLQDQIVDILPDEPDHILLALDLNRNGAYGIEKINIKTRGRITVERARGGIQEWIADVQGIPRLGWGYDDNELTIIYRQPTEEKFVPMQKRDRFVDLRGVTGFDDDPRFAFAFATIDGHTALIKLDLVRGVTVKTLFSHDKYDAQNVIMDPTGRRVVGVRYTDDYPRSHFFDPEYARIQKIIDRTLPETSNSIWQALAGLKRYVISVESDRQPLQFALFDLNEKTLDLIASTREDIDSELMAPVEPIHYVARDDTEVSGYLTRPLAGPATGLPMIVLPHGGPRTRDSRSFDYLVQLFASRGYAVLQANFRGSSGFGLTWQEDGENQWGGLMQDDLTDATQWAIDEGVADPKRICIVGWSYGGYAALMGAVKTPDLFQCAASINGVADIPDMIDNTHGFIGGLRMTEGMGLAGAKPRDVSPHHQADRIRIPLFLAAARDDAVVPFEQSRDLYRKLRKKLPVTYVEVETGGHSLDHEAGRLDIITGLVGFLHEHLD